MGPFAKYQADCTDLIRPENVRNWDEPDTDALIWSWTGSKDENHRK